MALRTKFWAVLLTGAVMGIASAANATEPPPVSFGNDSGAWSNDGECDDPRFTGEGMADTLMVEHIGRDASDCAKAWSKLTIEMNPLFLPVTDGREIEFGIDGSEFAHDGTCDDVRFLGDHSAEAIYLAEDIGRDASDCRAAMENGAVTYQGDELHPAIGQQFV